MKTIKLFLIAILLNSYAHAQIDSFTVSVGEYNHDHTGWFYQQMFVDSFSAGKKINHLWMNWQGNAWINSSLETFSYDTAGNLTVHLYQEWSGGQWNNQIRRNYTYLGLNQVETMTTQNWNGAIWKDSTLETHDYDGVNDTLILYQVWRNAAWENQTRQQQEFDGSFRVTEVFYCDWDSTSAAWINTVHYHHHYNVQGSEDSLVFQDWENNQWTNIELDYYNYDVFGNRTYFGENWWQDTVWWLAASTNYYYNGLNQLTSYDWMCYHGACGPANGTYSYDNNGNLVYSYSYSETMGGIVNEHRWSYYFNSNPILGNCTANATVTNATCFGRCDGTISMTMNGVPPFTYEYGWGVGSSLEDSLCAGSYLVIGTDSTGCSDTINVIITEPTVIIDTIVSTYMNCTCNYFANVSGGTPPYSYIWCNLSTAPQMINCNPGLCPLVITDANGCILYDTTTIVPLPPLSITAAGTNATCNGCSDGNITGVGSGGMGPYVYTLTPGGLMNSTGIFTGLSGGNYTVCVEDANVCSTCTTLVITEPGNCSVNIISVNGILCNGDCTGSLTAVGNGVPPFSYAWSNGESTATVDSLCAGIYNVTLTDSTGCTISTSVVVTEPSDISITHFTDYGCPQCITDLIVTGGTPGYTYQWCDGSIGPQLFMCGPGLCFVAVVDANGCLGTDTIFLTPPPPIILTTSFNGTTCAGCNDGSVLGNASGGNPPYIYILSPVGGSNTTGNFTALPAGIYTLCAIDADSCSTCTTDTVPDDPTGIFIDGASGDTRIFPNPFTDAAILETAGYLLSESMTFVLTDPLGKTLYKIPIISRQTFIERKNLAAGIYFYSIVSGEKNIAVGKLMLRD